MENPLPPIPAKRYFTIGEVGELCGVKPHVLRYWEQEFTQLRPMKRRGNRRYYQHHEVLMIRRIRELLYEHGFTIVGARNKLQEMTQRERLKPELALLAEGPVESEDWGSEFDPVHKLGTHHGSSNASDGAPPRGGLAALALQGEAASRLRHELLQIRQILSLGG